jgi:hypothetical protein
MRDPAATADTIEHSGTMDLRNSPELNPPLGH